MFRNAATKIAHNTTIPALAGNKDLRPLQDLIHAEKSVLISLQKLSVDINKAAEALRNWGATEGEDLSVRPRVPLNLHRCSSIAGRPRRIHKPPLPLLWWSLPICVARARDPRSHEVHPHQGRGPRRPQAPPQGRRFARG
ncbi:hypothetical protein EV715DRAFT_203809 [Schizophyllum commune]